MTERLTLFIRTAAASVLVFLSGLALSAQPPGVDPRPTIEDAIAAGATGSVSTVPSGPCLSMETILRSTEMVVVGRIGDPTSYMAPSHRAIYTDYMLTNATVLYDAHPSEPHDSASRPVVVTQLGGTIEIHGVRFTQKESGLTPLEPGHIGLFLLERVQGKNMIARRWYGAFDVTNAHFVPLFTREDFAAEYRALGAADAERAILEQLRQLNR
jgi:hypothetical protein